MLLLPESLGTDQSTVADWPEVVTDVITGPDGGAGVK